MKLAAMMLGIAGSLLAVGGGCENCPAHSGIPLPNQTKLFFFRLPSNSRLADARISHASSVSNVSMNAVNWLKRRVSLSTTPSSSILSPNPHSQNNLQPISERHHQQHQQSTNPTAFNSDRNAKGTPLNTSGRSVNSTPSSAQYLAQHDIIDPSSPLSILAATSKLTTFPYGELQALNARKTQQTNKSNSITNGVKNVVGVNGTGSTGHENNVVSAIPKPLSRQKRQRISLSTTTRHPTAKLLPSPIPQSTSTAGGDDMSEFQVPTPPSSQMDNHKRNATTSAVILRQRPQSKHNKSESLSSIQNTRSKRQKTSHPTTIPTIPDLPPLPKQPLPFHATRAPKTPPPTAPPSSTDGKQKRILPVRQGQVDILDGEISLLSTPQRLDSINSPHILQLTCRPSVLRTNP